jgi:uncharacterized protein (TIGR02246 family)
MHANATTKDSLEQLAHAVDTAYNNGDPITMASYWTEDGLNVNPFGDRFEGRPNIEADLRQALHGFMKGTTHQLSISDITHLNEHTAAADGIATITGLYGDATEALTSQFSMICTRGADGRWQIAQMRAYRFLDKNA